MCEEKAAVGVEDAAEREELGEPLAEGGGADAAGLAELASCHGPVGGAENLLDALFRRRTVRSWRRSRRRRVGGGGDAQCERVSVLVKLEGERGDGRSGAVLDGEGQAVLGAAEIEVAVAPCVKLGRAAECLSGAGGSGFAGVVDKNDGGTQAALELAQEVEERGDLGRSILVDAMETDERIEHEEPGAQGIDGLAQAIAVGRSVEAEHGDGDDVDIERIERDAGSRGDTGEALADHGERVLGSEEEHGPGDARRKLAQARRAGGDGDGEIEGEEGLAALGLAAEDADRLVDPEGLDEPAWAVCR